MTQLRPDIARVTLIVLFIGGLIAASLGIIKPFIPSIIWAATLTVATWPLLLWVERHVGHHRWVAVLIMTVTLLLTIIVPSWLAISTVMANIDQISDLARTILSLRIPPIPPWLASLPLIGSRAAELWGTVASARLEELGPTLAPYAGTMSQWFASAVGSLGGILLHFGLTTAVAAIMYAQGEVAAAALIRFGRRLGGDRGEMAIRLAGQAIRGVALGVVITALTQAVIAGVGLAVVGMPFATILTALMFVLCLIQIGPALVLIPSVIWLYYSGDALWATVLLAFSVVSMTIDQFIRPVLIRKGADLPILLILAGVLGGLVAFGVLGIFVGPTVLAVTYTLLNAWIDEDEAPGADVVGLLEPEGDLPRDDRPGSGAGPRDLIQMPIDTAVGRLG